MIWAHSAIQTMGNHPPNTLDIKIGVKPPANFWVFRWASLWNLDHCMEQSDPMMIVSTLQPREYREYPSLQITTHVRRIYWNLVFSVAKIKSQYSPIDVYIYNNSFFASILITLISDDDVSNETHKHESLTHSSCWKQPDTHTHTKRKLHFMEDFRRANRLIVHGLPSIPRKWTCHIVVGEDIIFQKASYQNSITTVTQLLATFACNAYFGH